MAKPRQIDTLVLEPACAPLLDALCAACPPFTAKVASPVTLCAAIRSGASLAVGRLLQEPFNAVIDEAAYEALVADGGKLLSAFVLFDDDVQSSFCSVNLVKTLCAKNKALAAAVVAPIMLESALSWGGADGL